MTDPPGHARSARSDQLQDGFSRFIQQWQQTRQPASQVRQTREDCSIVQVGGCRRSPHYEDRPNASHPIELGCLLSTHTGLTASLLRRQFSRYHNTHRLKVCSEQATQLSTSWAEFWPTSLFTYSACRHRSACFCKTLQSPFYSSPCSEGLHPAGRQ